MYALSLSASDDKEEPNREVVDEPNREVVDESGSLPRRTAASTSSIVFWSSRMLAFTPMLFSSMLVRPRSCCGVRIDLSHPVQCTVLRRTHTQSPHWLCLLAARWQHSFECQRAVCDARVLDEVSVPGLKPAGLHVLLELVSVG
eukprot:SAG25_NODE_51_length_18768_cov_901.153731_5_plen_144_part_00